MINKPVASITSADIDALVANAVPEGKTLEYKRDLPGATDTDKKEFLADASSFANTVGGDLLYGVQESAGAPTAVVGLGSANLDAEIRRLDDIVAAGIAPRMRYAIHRIHHDAVGPLLIVRVEQSWNAPHRVVFKGHDRFYARNSAGKYSLDVAELRNLFLSASTVVDRLREFQAGRLLDIASDRLPTALTDGARLVVHLLPLSAFATSEQLDISSVTGAPDELRPLSGAGWNYRITLEGFLTFAQVGRASTAYTHLYRNGIVEAVDGHWLNIESDGRRIIPSVAYERALLECTAKYLRAQDHVGVVGPVYVLIALLGAKGRWIATGHEFYDMNERYPVDRDPLLLPAAIAKDLDEDTALLLRPPIDGLWQACGYSKSPNFDSSGKLRPQ